MRRSILATLIQTLITAVALFAGAFFGVRSLAPGPAYAQDEPEVVRATKFELVDAVGKTKASLHLSRVGEPLLFMYGTDGRVRLSLSVVGDEPGLDLRDSEGYDRFSLSAQNGGSTLTMLDARNHARPTWASRRPTAPPSPSTTRRKSPAST